MTRLSRDSRESVVGLRGAVASQRVELQLHEWSAATPDTHQQLRDLSFGNDLATKMLARQLAQQGVVEVTELRAGLRVETTSYVGRVAVGPLSISVLPKVAWQRWIGLFSFAMRLRGLVRTEELAVRVLPSSLHDLIVLELLVETRDLVARGLHREYVRHRRDLTMPRGRIDFARIARRGGLTAAAMPCRYTRRAEDFHINRVLLAGLHAASRVATDVSLRSNVRHLAQQLSPQVNSIELTAESVASAQDRLDRRTARYAPALELIDLIRRGMLVSLEQPDHTAAVALRGFALDMNMLWQRLLGRVLHEWLPDGEVKQEYGLGQLIRPDPHYSPRRRSGHVPRPDFAVFRSGTLLMYLDAKYRDIWEKGLPREMLYQLALYASAHEGGISAIIYPTDHPEASEERLRIHNPQDESLRATVALRPVRLRELEEMIKLRLSDSRPERRARFAAALIAV